jgi:hypothetical protein
MEVRSEVKWWVGLVGSGIHCLVDSALGLVCAQDGNVCLEDMCFVSETSVRRVRERINGKM